MLVEENILYLNKELKKNSLRISNLERALEALNKNNQKFFEKSEKLNKKQIKQLDKIEELNNEILVKEEIKNDI